MAFTTYILMALLGTAILGFLAAWFFKKHELVKVQHEVKILGEHLNDEKSAIDQLRTESETQRLAIKNLHGLMQDIENQSFALEQKVKQSSLENEELREEKVRLMAEVDMLLREFETLRDFSTLNIEEESGDEDGDYDIRTKAKKLVKAFKKGYTIEPSPPPSTS